MQKTELLTLRLCLVRVPWNPALFPHNFLRSILQKQITLLGHLLRALHSRTKRRCFFAHRGPIDNLYRKTGAFDENAVGFAWREKAYMEEVQTNFSRLKPEDQVRSLWESGEKLHPTGSLKRNYILL